MRSHFEITFSIPFNREISIKLTDAWTSRYETCAFRSCDFEHMDGSFLFIRITLRKTTVNMKEGSLGNLFTFFRLGFCVNFFWIDWRMKGSGKEFWMIWGVQRKQPVLVHLNWFLKYWLEDFTNTLLAICILNFNTLP